MKKMVKSLVVFIVFLSFVAFPFTLFADIQDPGYNELEVSFCDNWDDFISHLTKARNNYPPNIAPYYTLNMETRIVTDEKGDLVKEQDLDSVLLEALAQTSMRTACWDIISPACRFSVLSCTETEIVVFDNSNTRALIVLAEDDLHEFYSAAEAIYYKNAFYLFYNTVEETNNAYEQYRQLVGEDNVSYDLIPIPEDYIVPDVYFDRQEGGIYEFSEWKPFVNELQEIMDEEHTDYSPTIYLDLEEDEISFISYDGDSEKEAKEDEILINAVSQDNVAAAKMVLEGTEYSVLGKEDNVLVLFDNALTNRLILFSSDEIESFSNEETVLRYQELYVLFYETTTDTRNAYAKYRELLGADHVSYDLICIPEAFSTMPTDIIPNASDSYVAWGTEVVGADVYQEAMVRRNDSQETIVAVIDPSGINANSSVYEGRLLSGYGEVEGQESYLTNDYVESNSHMGSVVSIIIDSTPDTVQILPIKISSLLGNVTALEAAADNGAEVINMSFHWGYNYNQTTINTLDTTFEEIDNETDENIVFVASGGNDRIDNSYHYPSASPYVLAVSSVEKDGYNSVIPSNWCAYGKIDYCAPGRDLKVYDGTAWSLKTGTSFAAPYIASLAAMIKGDNPGCSRSDTNTLLHSISLNPVTETTVAGDAYVGNGLPNVGDLYIPVSSVTLDNNDVYMTTEDSLTLHPVVSPSNAFNSHLIWSSSDTDVASVANGSVAAFYYGKATIKARSEDVLGRYDDCKVKVMFDDVTSQNTTIYAAINFLAYNNVAGGYPADNTFRINNGCTRVQAALMLWKLAGKPQPNATTDPFDDIASLSTSQRKAIRWCAEQGIVGGSNGHFSPNNLCTRSQAILMLWRFAGCPSASMTSLPYYDTTDYLPSSGKYKALLWAYEKSIARGSNGYFLPDNDCIRKYMALFLYKYATSDNLYSCQSCNQTYGSEMSAANHKHTYGHNILVGIVCANRVSSSIDTLSYHYGESVLEMY